MLFKKGHIFHLVDPSPWSLSAVFIILNILLSMLLYMNKYQILEISAIMCGALFFTVIMWWLINIVRESSFNLVSEGLRFIYSYLKKNKVNLIYWVLLTLIATVVETTADCGGFDNLLGDFHYKIMEIATVDVESNQKGWEFTPVEFIIIHDNVWNNKFGNIRMLGYIKDFTFIGDVEIKEVYHGNNEIPHNAEFRLGHLIIDGITYNFKLYVFLGPDQHKELLIRNQIPILKAWERGDLNLTIYTPGIMECYESDFLDIEAGLKLYFDLKKARGPRALDHGILIVCDRTGSAVYSIKPTSTEWINKFVKIRKNVLQKNTELNLKMGFAKVRERALERLELKRSMGVIDKELIDLMNIKKWKNFGKRKKF